jgi:hypothetical protein
MQLRHTGYALARPWPGRWDRPGIANQGDRQRSTLADREPEGLARPWLANASRSDDPAERNRVRRLRRRRLAAANHDSPIP